MPSHRSRTRNRGSSNSWPVARILSPYLNPYSGRLMRPTAAGFAHRNRDGSCRSVIPESGMRYQSRLHRPDLEFGSVPSQLRCVIPRLQRHPYRRKR